MGKREISLKLKELRKNKKLTIDDVQKLLEKRNVFVATKTIYGWEGGQRLPKPDIFLDLCDIYGVYDILSYFEIGGRKKENIKLIAREDGIQNISMDDEKLEKLKESTKLITKNE